MSTKVFRFCLLAGILLLSACSLPATAPTATATSTSTRPPTATVTALPPTATEMPSTPTPAATPTEAIPTNLPDCTNSAKFIEDITVKDDSEIPAGSTFTKTWRVQNTGTCTWWSGYTLTHYSAERMAAPEAVPLKLTRPGEITDISVELTASQALGKHEGYFVIKNPSGLIMRIDNDSRLWVKITVVKGTPATAATPANTATIAPTGNTQPGNTPAAGNGPGYAAVTCAYTEDDARAQQVVQIINDYRAQNGLPPYSVNTQLSEAAQAHASDMACNQIFQHTGSNGSTPQTRVAASGYLAARVTENVYGSYPPLTPEQVVLWWKTDKQDINHNKNLLSSVYKEIGVGYAFFNNFGYYVVVFATP
jgi:uncharacterized protein YkwD